jgi:hypothetical protein
MAFCWLDIVELGFCLMASLTVSLNALDLKLAYLLYEYWMYHIATAEQNRLRGKLGAVEP